MWEQVHCYSHTLGVGTGALLQPYPALYSHTTRYRTALHQTNQILHTKSPTPPHSTTPHHTTPHHTTTIQHTITPCHTSPHHATPHHTMPHLTTPRHTSTHHVTPQHTMPHFNTPCHTSTHNATPQHTMPHIITPCHTSTHHATPQHTMPHLNTPCHTSTHHATPQHTLPHLTSHPAPAAARAPPPPIHSRCKQQLRPRGRHGWGREKASGTGRPSGPTSGFGLCPGFFGSSGSRVRRRGHGCGVPCRAAWLEPGTGAGQPGGWFHSTHALSAGAGGRGRGKPAQQGYATPHITYGTLCACMHMPLLVHACICHSMPMHAYANPCPCTLMPLHVHARICHSMPMHAYATQYACTHMPLHAHARICHSMCMHVPFHVYAGVCHVVFLPACDGSCQPHSIVTPAPTLNFIMSALIYLPS